MFFLLTVAELPKLTPTIPIEMVVAQNKSLNQDIWFKRLSEKSSFITSSLLNAHPSALLSGTSFEKKALGYLKTIQNWGATINDKKVADRTFQISSKQQSKYQQTSQLITQERDGDRKTFEIPVTGEESETESTPIPVDSVDVVEVIADRQEYNESTQVITAEGNVVMRFAESVLKSDRIQINLADRIAVAEGNVTLTRGEQILQGSRFEYYLVQDRGTVTNARGQIDRSALNLDLTNRLPEDRTIPDRTLNDRLILSQPVTEVEAKGQFQINLGNNQNYNILQGKSDRNQTTINRVRFEANNLEFEGSNWQATDLRLTNDPFSPPELELRVDTAKLEQTEPLVNQLTTTRSRLVIDDSLTIPLLKNRFVFDRRPQNPGLFDLGFDGEERGGLYIERTWNLIDGEQTTWSITPQYFLQRSIAPDLFGFSDENDGGFFDPAVFGLKSQFNTVLSPRNGLEAQAAITSFDFDEFEDNLRAKVAATQLIGNLNNPHSFSLEANFRERLFNGSLGFQTVYSSVGGIFPSPQISLGKTGINLQYQASIQNINANSDREELIGANQNRDRTNLTRYQGAAFLGKSLTLWSGKPLPATKKKALRYSPFPVVPYLQINTGISSVASLYSNNDDQISLRGNIGIQGQLGHFSRNWFDYTGFNLTYSIGTDSGESPFIFDRDADRQTLALGINQQLYGPIRLGVQTSWNLDNGDDISTDYILEYSRRTHGITLRYNPVLEIGSFSFQINDFAWRGNPQPFEKNDIRPVIQGVDR
jgi:lipopolysaccharide export system protein LptC